MDLRKLRDKAAEAFAKGKFTKAAELYTEYCHTDKKDMQAQLRMGDAWAKAGVKKKAVDAYRAAAETFARDGFLPRAIAASKLILELDPGHQSMQKMLADLYARKSGRRDRADPSASKEEMEPWKSEPQPRRRREPIEVPPEEPASIPVAEAPTVRPTTPVEIELSTEDEEPKRREWSNELPPELEIAAPGHEQSPKRVSQSAFDELDLDDAGTGGNVRSTPEIESFLQAVESAAHPERRETRDEELVGLYDANEPTPSGLPKIPLFSDLPPNAFIELFERCPLRRVLRGERIIEQGSFGNAFYVICSGSVRVYREENRNRIELAKLEEGAFFGEMALLSGAARIASVEASSDEAQLLEISAPVLAQLSRQYPSVADALKRFCRQRLLTNVMNSSAFFRPFDRKDRRDLVERFRAREVPRGETIAREGQESHGLYVILSGEVEIHKSGSIVARLKEGDIFGEISLLQKTPASASVISSKRTSLLRLPREEFDALMMSHPQLLVLVSELTEDRLRQNDAVMEGVAVLGDEGLMLV